MSLQRRLTLYFVMIVILPLAIAGVLVQRVVVEELARRSLLSLRPALDSAVTAYNGQLELLGPETRSIISTPRFARLLGQQDVGALQLYAEDLLRVSEVVDFLIIRSPDGTILASAGQDPGFLVGFEPPTFDQIAQSDPGSGRGFERTPAIEVRVAGRGVVGEVIGGIWLDRSILVAPGHSDVELSVVLDERIVATTAALVRTVPVDLSFDEQFEVDVAGSGRAEAERLPGDMALIATTPTAPIDAVSRQLVIQMLAVLTIAIVAMTALAAYLSRLLTRELEELSEGARAIAEGRFDMPIPVRSKDEVGQLAVAFNDMRDKLSSSYSQLSSSRDQLQRAIRRVGETLRSTHDMKQMLESILNTTADAVGADAACLWMFSPTRDELHPSYTAGLAVGVEGAVRVGEGVVGFVAERAVSVLLPSRGGPEPSRNEPRFPVAIAAPFYADDRIIAILATYRRDEYHRFTPEDMETVEFLAKQGGIAVENVRLHEEAQRLSLTDGLTGIWNRRFFQMQFRQVLATGTRFERPFSILMLDLDRFKALNDTHGHQRGDAILIEFSQRVKHTLREVDTFARYGGEEFIALLPETDEEGAAITAEKIREAILSQPFGSLGDEPVDVTVSIGVSSYPRHGSTFHDLVETADRALYRAKEQGRNQVCVADDEAPPLKVAR
ncbi:MAG TPA: diguanylate cyclase [Actinomycetota bacterium]|nr:diguanylate cyclase [Actinomycetota bacterium]